MAVEELGVTSVRETASPSVTGDSIVTSHLTVEFNSKDLWANLSVYLLANCADSAKIQIPPTTILQHSIGMQC